MIKKFTRSTILLGVAILMSIGAYSCTNETEKPIDPPPPVIVDSSYIKVYSDKELSNEQNSNITVNTDENKIVVYIVSGMESWRSAIDIEGDWIAMDPMSGEKGSTAVSITVAANPYEKERSAKITYVLNTENSADQKEIVLNITQDALPPFVGSRESDSLALVSLYNALGGEECFDESWNLNEPITGYKNLRFKLVNGEMRVDTLGLINGKLKGTLPADLGNLRELTKLKMESLSRIKGGIPESLGNCKNLTYLNIKNCMGITALPSEVNWPMMDTLMIDGVSISAVPSSLAQSTKMNIIVINSLKEKVPSIKMDLGNILSGMNDLVYADFSQIDYDGEFTFLRGKSKLQEFKIREGNNMTGDVNFKENLKGLDNLFLLWLHSSPGLTGSVEGMFGTAPMLSKIVLSDSKITGTIEQSGLLNVPESETANCFLNNNEITGEIPEWFYDKCKQWDLSMNKLNGELPANIVDLIKISNFTKEKTCPQKEGFGFTNC